MSKDSFPAWFYNPETKEGQIFESADDVPEGWVDRLDGEPKVVGSKAKAPKAQKTEPTDDTSMTRAEMIEALKNGGVEFKVTAKNAELHDLLKGKVMEVLTQRQIAFDADAPVRDLLEKLG